MIEINNLTTNPVDEEFLRKSAKIVLDGESASWRMAERKKDVDLSIAFVGQGRMREINKRYRGKNRVTDVLSFPESKVLLQKFKVGPSQKIQGLGEIIICLREVKKNAKKFSSSFEKELNKVLIHGILHLLGYDHEKGEEKAEEMEEKEKYYLSKVF
ncbi:rRNA maturation RNase YbeY [Candidatus Parcubacteria bacterium]|nr:rRNA maturation RNase YbeY [Candidatus Parcubacteria bacterium]